MRNRLRAALLLVILPALGLLLIFLWGTPRLLWVEPGVEASNVPASSEVRLTFSRPLQTDALKERLRFEPAITGSFEWQGSSLVFTPDRPWPAGATVQVQVQPGSPARGFPALPLRQGKVWSFRVRQPNIAYLFPASGPANVYLLNPTSGESTPLTNSPAGVLDFTISPDGEMLYFSARTGPDGSAVYRLDLTGLAPEADAAETLIPEPAAPASLLAQPVQMLDCPKAVCQGLALEPQGRYLAYERSVLPGGDGSQITQVWIQGLEKSEAHSPILAGAAAHQTVLPAWSNAGLLAFYDLDDEAYWFVGPDGSQKARFPNQTGQQGAWRPDGAAFLAPEIFYLSANISPDLSNLESLADSHLILFDLATNGTENLTPGEGVEDTSPAYSPKGDFLAFARKYLDVQGWTPGRQLWIARTESREARQLTDTPLFNHYDLAWSPAGDQLAFVRFNQSALTEPPEIWIFDLLSSAATRFVQDGYQPQWLP